VQISNGELYQEMTKNISDGGKFCHAAKQKLRPTKIRLKYKKNIFVYPSFFLGGGQGKKNKTKKITPLLSKQIKKEWTGSYTLLYTLPSSVINTTYGRLHLQAPNCSLPKSILN
jgi:late competence protein required for DNA uptake (superfamily II DNA/RNA helicase)